MINKDNFLLFVLLMIVVYYLTVILIVKLTGNPVDNSAANKEIIIYILGIVSGGIYNNKKNENL